jgi:hypothetical protein
MTIQNFKPSTTLFLNLSSSGWHKMFVNKAQPPQQEMRHAG